jgi:hypothetical protein
MKQGDRVRVIRGHGPDVLPEGDVFTVAVVFGADSPRWGKQPNEIYLTGGGWTLFNMDTFEQRAGGRATIRFDQPQVILMNGDYPYLWDADRFEVVEA